MRISASPRLTLSRSSARGRVSRLLRGTRRLRVPFAVLSSGFVAFLAPGLLGVWLAVLFFVFALLPRPWQGQRPPLRVWSPAGQRWLAQQRRAVRSARVYLL